MTLFQFTIPFTAYSSLTTYFIYLLVMFSIPIAFLQIIARTANYHFPLWAYVTLMVISLFIPMTAIINILLDLAIIIIAMYFFGKPQKSYTQLIAMSSTGFFIYFASAITINTIYSLVFGKALLLPPLWSILTDIQSIVIFIIALPIIHFYRPFYKRNLEILANRHPVPTWVLSALLLTASIASQLRMARTAQFPPLIFFLIFIATALIANSVIKIVAKYYASADRAVTAEYNYENLVQYTSDLEVAIDDLRRFKHDYKNILYSLESALNTNNVDYAKQVLGHLKSSTTPLIQVPTNLLGPLQNIEDIDVKSIIFNKIQTALKQNLKIQLEVEEPIKLTKTVAPVDAVRIIAILLDNAIKAASKSKDKQVHLSLFETDFAQFIVVANSTADQEVDLNHLAELSQPSFGRKSHFGLRNLQIILANYPDASNDRSSNNYHFEQRIILPKQNNN